LDIKININYKNLSLYKMAGFYTKEFNFFISVQKYKNNLSIWLYFSIGQHLKDVSLLEGIVILFGCSYVINYAQRLI
jgi:hypothetical protein